MTPDVGLKINLEEAEFIPVAVGSGGVLQPGLSVANGLRIEHSTR